jgi:plastocyanin
MVEIGDDFFSPNVLTVDVGDTVRWTHIGTEGEPHTTTNKDHIWDSGPLMMGDTFEFQFNNTGSFRYICFFHSSVMQGVVIVRGGVHMINIDDDFFSPAAITVNVGDVVRWTHIGDEGEPHTSTSKTRIWNSGPLFEGDTFEFQFNAPGQYPYFCFFHSTIMHGMVDVVDAGASQAVSESSIGTEQILADQDIAQQTKLLGSYPNPFNPSTNIQYSLGQESHVTLRVYNSVGQEVATLVNEFQGAGNKTVTWNGKNNSGSSVASGLYIYTLETGGVVLSEKILLMK